MHHHDRARFLACHDCGVLHPVAGRPVQLADDLDAETMDEYDTFVTAHAGHHTTRLRRHGFESRSDRPFWDPLATVMFEATDGQRTYVVSASRLSIDEPRLYRFMPGTLQVTASEVDVETADICRGLDMEFHPYALRPTKLDRFLAVLHEVVSHIDPDELEVAFDAADDPAVSIAPMPEPMYRELLARCAEIFDPWELTRVNHFLDENRAEDGLLALRVRRHLTALTA